MKIFGLGQAGCRLAKAFAKFPQYETVGIDVTREADITIKKRSSHEEYEKHFPSLKRKLDFEDEQVCVAVCGVGAISGGVLRLLEQLQGNEVSVLYIQPDLTLASETQQTIKQIKRNKKKLYAMCCKSMLARVHST